MHIWYLHTVMVDKEMMSEYLRWTMDNFSSYASVTDTVFIFTQHLLTF